MASFFGSVATEVGQGVKENVANKREERLKDEEYAREQQLAKQRMAFDSSELNRRLAAEAGRQAKMIEANRLLEDSRQEFEGGYRDEDRQAGMDEAELKAQTDILTTAMRVYASQSESGYVRGNDWTTKVEKSIDMQTGEPTETIYATHNGRTYQQQGDKMFDAGTSANPAQFNSIDQQRAAEAKLHNGDVTAEQFKDVFGYIPAAYVFGEVSKGSDFGSFLKKNSIRIPAFGIGDDDRRGGGGGPGSSSNASRRLMEIDMSKEGGATSEDMDNAVRQRRSEEGLPEHPENINKFNNPYQAGREGKTSAWGEGVIRSRDSGRYLLSQGQAAAGEVPAPLETGGQLTPAEPMGPEAPSAQVAAPGGGELDDAGAAEISQAVQQAWVNQSGRVEIPAVKRFGESLSVVPVKGMEPVNPGSAE